MRLNTCPLIFAQIRLTVESRTAFCCGCCLSDLGKFWGVWCLSGRNICIISDETFVIYKSLLVPISVWFYIANSLCKQLSIHIALSYSLLFYSSISSNHPVTLGIISIYVLIVGLRTTALCHDIPRSLFGARAKD